jgi:LysR family glycine cleavage system transcriptional activator
MKRTLPPLVALRAFEAAGRHSSFLQAAAELNVTQSAVSRNIKVLEKFLNQSLFTRLTRRVQLTSFGRSYLSAISSGLDAIEDATTEALSPKTTLKVTIMPTTANLWLLPRLSTFTETHHDIEVDVATSIQPVDFAKDDVDVAIRLGRRPGQHYRRDQPRIPHEMVTGWNGVYAHKLCSEILVPVCSRKLLEHGPPLKTPADLRHYPMIHVAGRESAWPDWLRAVRAGNVSGKSKLVFGHFFMALQAARNHRGIAIASALHLQSLDWLNELAFPFSARVKSAGDYYFLCRERDAGSQKIRLFRRWLDAQVKQCRPL